MLKYLAMVGVLVTSPALAQNCANGQCGPVQWRTVQVEQASVQWAPQQVVQAPTQWINQSPMFNLDTRSGVVVNPGETLLSVGGVPVGSSNVVSPTQTTIRQRTNLLGTTVTRVRSSGGTINLDAQAYAWAQREANMIAAMGEQYYRGPGGGHPLGVAPGCRYSGTGFTRDENRPGHCYENELPESRIVARAKAPGPNGTWFWSAHYR